MNLSQFLLDCTITWTLLYLVYYTLLRKETFFRINRIYLLASLVLGVLMPFLRNFAQGLFKGSGAEMVAYPISTVVYLGDVHAAQADSDVSTWAIILGSIYTLGVVFFATRMIGGFWKIYRLYQRGRIEHHEDFTMVFSSHYHLPFSFFRWIFWSNKFEEKDLDLRKIIDHEVAHVKGRHCLDVVVVEALLVLFWWHPIVFLYRHSIKKNHEFISDHFAGIYGNTYKGLFSIGNNVQLALTNQFFNQHIKERIKMIEKHPSAKWLRWKFAAAVPVMLMLCVIMAFKTDDSQKRILKSCTDRADYEAQMNCTSEQFLRAAYTSVQYDAQARKQNIQGYVVLGLVYNAEGLKSFKILHSDHDLLMGGIVPMIKGIEDLKFNLKGRERLWFSVPIKFKLESETYEYKAVPDQEFSYRRYPAFIEDDNIVVVGYGVAFAPDQHTEKKGEVHLNIRGNVVEGHVNGEGLNLLTDSIGGTPISDEESGLERYGREGELGVVQIYLKEESTNTPVEEKPKPTVVVFNTNGSSKFISDVDEIDPALIEKVNVLKGQRAIDAYGEEVARNGVVEIFLKAEENNSDRVVELPDTENTDTEIELNPEKVLNATIILIDKTGEQRIVPDPVDIKTESIEKINVLKGDVAIEAYGKELAENGVVEIYLKDGSSSHYKFEQAELGAEKNEESEKPKPTVVVFNAKGSSKFISDPDQIDPTLIEKVNVLKGQRAIDAYGGEAAKNGVVEIYLKKGAKLPADPLDEKEPLIKVFDYSGDLSEKYRSMSDLANLDPSLIDRVNALKGESAVNAYGDEAKNGVLEVHLKKGVSMLDGELHIPQVVVRKEVLKLDEDYTIDRDGKVIITNPKYISANVPVSISSVPAKQASTNLENWDVNLYPNPAKEVLFINANLVPKGARDVNMQLRDMTGNIISREKVPVEHGNIAHRINIADLPAGRYSIVFETSVKVITKQFVKTK